MFEDKKYFPLFPTTVWGFKLSADDTKRINADVVNLLDRLIAAAPAKTDQLQTAHDLHTLPEMEELNGFFMNGVGEVLDALATEHTEMEITGCWANIHPADFPHRSHSHSNNFLSAVYYVTAPEGGNTITFEDPRIQPTIMFPPVKELNCYTAEYADINVVDGLLLLFPSWLVHSVPPGDSKARRISIAFNVNFTDFSARISPPLWEANVPTHPRSS
jgi:uncharacterized protein (TIGR02466 family)